jgi:thioredoxin-like negative regulator of GroEL
MPNRFTWPANRCFQRFSQTFQADVIERPRQLPVVLLWAEQIPVRKDKRTLETCSGNAGKFAPRRCAWDQALAQHLRVQALPSLRAVRTDSSSIRWRARQGCAHCWTSSPCLLAIC